MVYSQICDWLNDFVESDPPTELFDTWDCTEWVTDSEIIEVFKEFVLPSYKSKKAQEDSQVILESLIWEYYLFRRAEALHKFVYDPDLFERLKALKSVPQHTNEWLTEKTSLLTASEFSTILNDGAERMRTLKSKAQSHIVSATDEPQQTVFLTNQSGKLAPMAWGHRFEPVVRKLYETISGNTVYCEVGRVRHAKYSKLAASPDGVVSDGSLLEIKAPITREIEKDTVPYPYYCQMQIQMEVCDVNIATYCECRFASGDSFTADVSVTGFVGALAVYGRADDFKTWEYIYSPLFPDTDDGRMSALQWVPAGDVGDSSSSSTESDCQLCTMKINELNGEAEFTLCSKCKNPSYVVLEKKVWQVTDWQLLKLLRNPRWWSSVGLPEYNRFFKDVAAAKADPMFLMPSDGGALFVDEDKLYSGL